MARINVWVPDDLAADARHAGLNVSALTQAALSAELAGRATDAWLDTLREPRTNGPSNEAVLDAIDDAREEFGSRR